MTKYVYVASSWRNNLQPVVCRALAEANIDHYDFKNPPNGAGFGWEQVNPNVSGLPIKGSDWVNIQTYRLMLAHSKAVEGFAADFGAMQRAGTFVLVLPCGKSAHLELGWAVGAGKRTAILLEDPVEPELMYKMVDCLASTIKEVVEFARG